MTERIEPAHVVHLLPAYVAGTLEPTEQREVLAHLADCPACRAERAAWEMIHDALRDSHEAVPADERVLQEVWNRVDADPVHAASPTRQDRRQPHQRVAQPQWPVSPTVPPTRSDSGAHAPRPMVPRSRRAIGQIATVLLLVLTLGLGYVTLRLERAPGDEPAGIPALIVAPATPSPSTPSTPRTGPPALATPPMGRPVDGTLAAITLPTGAMPTEIIGGLNHYSVPAGSEGTWDWTCCTGPRLDVILEGAYTIRGAGPMQVLRGAGGSWEEITPGTEIVLDAGDALYSRLEDTFEAVNPGSTAVQLLDVVLFEGTPPNDPVPYAASGVAAWQYHDQDIWQVPVSVPPGPVTLRVRQADLATEATLPLPDGAIMQLVISRDAGAILGKQTDFSVNNLSQKPIALYALSVEPAHGESETATTDATAP